MDLFTKKHTPETGYGPSQKVTAAPGYGVVNFFFNLVLFIFYTAGSY